MKHYARIVLAMMAALVVVFVVVRAAEIDVLVDPRAVFEGLGAAAAIAAVALLIVDVVLPVPSSIVMMWLGATYGWATGAVLAIAGCVAATAVAFWLG